MPGGFARRVIVLPPGTRRRYHPEEWEGALVCIERGQIHLERAGQVPQRFRKGDLLWLTGLGLSAIHNPGPQPAVLTATSRRPTDRRPT